MTKNKGGRPLLKLDESQIVELARIHCTMKEIAAVMKCSVSTLERNFDDIIKEATKEGKTSLRRYMWKACEKGNITMMIWLSKNLLGMREPQVIEIVREEAKSPFNAWYDTQQIGKKDSNEMRVVLTEKQQEEMSNSLEKCRKEMNTK